MELVCDYVCTISENNIHIKDSYKVKERSEMCEILYIIQHNHPECKVFKRSYDSMISEGRAHNRLYRGGYKRQRTSDVDINYPLKGYVELAYRILGI